MDKIKAQLTTQNWNTINNLTNLNDEYDNLIYTIRSAINKTIATKQHQGMSSMTKKPSLTPGLYKLIYQV